MAQTLTTIQGNVRFFGRDDTIDLTTGTGLVIANTVYRTMSAMMPWPELRRTTSLAATTTSGTGYYAWLATPVYTDVKAFEIGADTTNTSYILLFNPPSETIWSETAKQANGIPNYFMRYNSAGNNYVELRPIPNYTGATMRVLGTIEPTAFVDGTSVTVYLSTVADDALAHMIAAAYLMRNGMDANVIQYNMQAGQTILQSLFVNEQITQEIVRQIANA